MNNLIDKIEQVEPSVTRMVTLSRTGRMKKNAVELELAKLDVLWTNRGASKLDDLGSLLDEKTFDELDPFDRAQLAEVAKVCQRSKSLSEAGRTLISISRKRRKSSNDADRLRK